MKKLIIISFAAFSMLGSGCYSFNSSAPPISERRARAIVLSLPEVAALTKRYESQIDQLSIDCEGLSREDTRTSAEIGHEVWTIGIYCLSPDRENWWPWAFFVVNARTGAVSVREPDWSRKELDAFAYRSLADWRRSREQPNAAPEPASIELGR
jgi:hypothetical protein